MPSLIGGEIGELCPEFVSENIEVFKELEGSKEVTDSKEAEVSETLGMSDREVDVSEFIGLEGSGTGVLDTLSGGGSKDGLLEKVGIPGLLVGVFEKDVADESESLEGSAKKVILVKELLSIDGKSLDREALVIASSDAIELLIISDRVV